VYFGGMSKNDLMKKLEKRAFDCRIELPALCKKAGVSRTVAYRYLNEGTVPTLPTIGKLEKALEL
jgi:DNA-binding phage protein